MSVKLTSPVLGQDVGYVYTGNLEDWLLAQGYATRDADTSPTSYTGPGVDNDGATDVAPDDDPRLASNRGDAPYFPSSEDRNVTIANDATNLTKDKFPAPGFDVDPGGADDDAPANVTLDPATGPAAGGTVVTITGDNLAGVTDVTFGGASGTALDVSGATGGEGTIQVTTPAGTAGARDVVLVDPSGNLTLTGGFTYA